MPCKIWGREMISCARYVFTSLIESKTLSNTITIKIWSAWTNQFGDCTVPKAIATNLRSLGEWQTLKFRCSGNIGINLLEGDGHWFFSYVDCFYFAFWNFICNFCRKRKLRAVKIAVSSKIEGKTQKMKDGFFPQWLLKKACAVKRDRLTWNTASAHCWCFT